MCNSAAEPEVPFFREKWPSCRPFAVAVVARGAEGVIGITDPEKARKGDPLYVKFPGGRGRPGENPEEAARREFAEEAGVWIPEGAVLFTLYHEVRDEDPENVHDFYVLGVSVLPHSFVADYGFIEGYPGGDGELPFIIPVETLRKRITLPSHKAFFKVYAVREFLGLIDEAN